MPSYMTLAEYKTRTTIPASLVDSCTERGKDPAFWLAMHSSTIRARLVKRYAVDFGDPGPVPDQIIEWLIVLMDIEVWKTVGGNPEGRIDGWYDTDAKRVRDELKEAVDSKDGLFELPLRSTDPLGSSAVNVGGPLGYSEASPYAWTDRQVEAVRNGC
jgi:hypothetical protein